tara:strand:- start:210 stop:668 length:459 start_codon:yes stop_codon:yes gene_type:complete
MVIEGSMKEYTPVSAGAHKAVLVDVVDLGLETVEYEGERTTKPKLKLVFEVDEKTDDGKAMVIGRKLTASTHERSNLTKVLQTWLGRSLTIDERNRLDLDEFIGTSAEVMVIHKVDDKDGRVWARIDGVYPAKDKLKPSKDYQRVKDRIDIN